MHFYLIQIAVAYACTGAPPCCTCSKTHDDLFYWPPTLNIQQFTFFLHSNRIFVTSCWKFVAVLKRIPFECFWNYIFQFWSKIRWFWYQNVCHFFSKHQVIFLSKKPNDFFTERIKIFFYQKNEMIFFRKEQKAPTLRSKRKHLTVWFFFNLLQ